MGWSARCRSLKPNSKLGHKNRSVDRKMIGEKCITLFGSSLFSVEPKDGHWFGSPSPEGW